MSLLIEFTPHRPGDPPFGRFGQGFVGEVLVGEIRGAAPRRVFQRIEDRAFRRDRLELQVAVPDVARVDHADVAAVRVDVIRQHEYFRVVPKGVSRVVVDDDATEAPGKGDLVFRREALLPEAQHLMGEKRLVDFGEGFVVHRLRQVEPDDFRAERFAESTDSPGHRTNFLLRHHRAAVDGDRLAGHEAAGIGS